MKIIHVGLGVRGRLWLGMVRAHAGTISVACIDPRSAALEWTKAHFPPLGDSCYPEINEALKSTQADAAIIATPLPLRASHAILALEAGLSVMIEKPFAARVADAAKVLETARRTGRAVLVAQAKSLSRAEQTLKALVHERKVGSITHVSYIDRRSYAPGNRSDEAPVKYSQLMDCGARHFDSLPEILDAGPVTIMARCSKAPWSEYPHGSTTEALLEMEHDIHVQYHASLTSNRSESSVWIEGNDGVVRTLGSHVWWRKRGWRFFAPIRPRRQPAAEALEYPPEGPEASLNQLRAAVIDGRAPESSVNQNLRTVAMIEGAIVSHETGRVVHVGELLAAAGVPSFASTDSRYRR